MATWINGRRSTRIDVRDRGLQYGDGLFETMRVRRGRIRLVDYHLQRLDTGCRRLGITGVSLPALRRELSRIARPSRAGVLKLIVTRGPGPRGYRPTGRERCTRIVMLHALPVQGAAEPPVARVRLCATPLGQNPGVAGLKTLNRLESVLARAEWRDESIWEGLMSDVEQNIVCGTMSNLFLRRGSKLLTPPIDRCGVLGVMRRWVMETAGDAGLEAAERRIKWRDLREAEEVFMTNAIVGIRSVGLIERGRQRVRPASFDGARRLRSLLELL